jgi:hypothetical protein
MVKIPAYPCLIARIDACKDPREALGVEGVAKYETVREVMLEMIVRLDWTKRVLRI